MGIAEVLDMTTRYPMAYIRRSSADANDPGDVSREAQESAVRELARRDGHNGELRIVVDWDRSADEAKESRRTAFVSMLAAIERGEVSAVYAASLDRLYRSLRTFVKLTDAAKAQDVRIVTLREGVLGGDGSPMAQAFAQITAVFSALELNTTKARAAGALAVRRDRGDHLGRVGYGYRFAIGPDGRLARNAAGGVIVEPDPDHPLEPMIGAVREAGSILGGAKLLQARGIPSPEDSAVWGSTTLRRIIERHAPELIPSKGPTGRRQPSAGSVLAQLLVCHCEHVLTPEPSRRAYRCRLAVRRGSDAHGLGWVAEAAILPWVRAEVARLRLPVDAVTMAADNAAQRNALAARLERANDLFVLGSKDGGWTRERRDAEAAVVAAELDRLGDAEALIGVSPIRPEEWDTWAPDDLNAYLRAILRRVDLGPDLRPVSAVWRNPKLRA